MAQEGNLEGRGRLEVASAHSKRQRCASPEGEVGSCSQFGTDHPPLMDIALWETLPAVVVERICAMLPVSQIFELLKLCEPWPRLPSATNFRKLCAEAHRESFGIMMFDKNSLTYRLSIYDCKHEEWFHMEVNNMPSDYVKASETFELVYGQDGGLLSVILHPFLSFKGPPRILVFNPLTGEKKYIGVSSLTASRNIEEMYAVMLQLIMDEERQCYKLILVTQRTKGRRSRGGEYYSESYDSVSGLWSTLDSGFVNGDGVLGGKCYHVCFDCSSKKFCIPEETSVSESLAYFTNDRDSEYLYSHYYTFVRDHRFMLDYEFETDEGIPSLAARITESVWQDCWKETSTIVLPMEDPVLDTFDVRLLACTRYVLLVAHDVEFDIVDFENRYEDRHQRMVLYDRVTRKEVCAIPQFLTREFGKDANFMKREYANDEYAKIRNVQSSYNRHHDDFVKIVLDTDENLMKRNVQFMCDLKWDVNP